MKHPYRLLGQLLAYFIHLAIPGILTAQPAHIPGCAEELQSHLYADEVLIEYVLTDTSVLINAIGRESSFSSTQSLNQLFWFCVRSFRKKLTSAEPLNFLVPGEILYMFLIKPLQQFISGRRRLIIIPGDRLAGLPFEAFIRSDSLSLYHDLCSRHYLIRDHEVVYHHSKDSWNERIRDGGREDHLSADQFNFFFLGFSPVYKKNRTCTALPSARNEIFEIGALFRQKGKSLWLGYEELTDKDYFKQMVCKGRIVHLAAHHDACLLTCDEIAGLHLGADLIVLNSCSSGIYKVNEANSGNSPAQVFYNAGAKNVLSTLWNVTDALARQFMVDFYRIWLTGKSYSDALREVKMQWISCSATTMPSIWAPYVLMGE
jgi:CHAT domain-containing protein